MKHFFLWSLILFIGSSTVLLGASRPKDPEIDLYLSNLFYLTEVMVTDVASPPAAARYYAYATLASHIAWVSTAEIDVPDHLLNYFNKQGLDFKIETSQGINPYFVANYTLLETGAKMMPSGQKLLAKQNVLIEKFLKNKWITKKALGVNIAFAKAVSEKSIKFATADAFNRLSSYTRYTPLKGEGYWYPTPPAYMAAVEPEWRSLRTFFVDEINQFMPPPPAPFDLSEGSPFLNQMNEVYEVTSSLSEEQKLIANFWDCNPFKVDFSGHMAIGLKKISPGGHWVGIAGIACKKAKKSMGETIFIHTLLSMGLHDAFVSCWKEKYESNRIRPETAINRHLDPNWKPILQTPPFPEYTSGHSVVSKLSAVLLTSFFGEDFEFVDTSEVYFGLPERTFESFHQAAEEAAISRLYGGIHFKDAIVHGSVQGENIGKMILQKLAEN
jgi:hypothetical protein